MENITLVDFGISRFAKTCPAGVNPFPEQALATADCYRIILPGQLQAPSGQSLFMAALHAPVQYEHGVQ